MNKTAAAKTTNRKINMDGRNHNLLDIIKFKCFHALALAYCIHTCNQPTRACCLFHTYNNNNNDRLTAFDPGQPG